MAAILPYPTIIRPVMALTTPDREYSRINVIYTGAGRRCYPAIRQMHQTEDSK